MSEESLTMSWFSVFVGGRRPAATIRGLPQAFGMRNLNNSGISRGGLLYTGGVRETENGNPGFYPKVVDATLIFEPDAEGRMTVTLEQGGGRMKAARK